MESPNGPCPRLNTISANREKIETPDLQTPEEDDSSDVLRSDHVFRYTDTLEIVRETMRILRYNQTAFMAIWALLICPVSALHLLNILVDQSTVNQVTVSLLSIAKSNGFPLNPFVYQCSHKFSETAISSIVCFPFFITVLLISKAAVVYSVECTYSRKKFDLSKFYVIMNTIWRRIISTYFSICAVNVGCFILFVILLMGFFYILPFLSNSIAYATILIEFFFFFFLVVFLAHTIIVCDLSLVISVLEDVSGIQALLRSSLLIRGQTQGGLIIFLGSTIGMTIVKGLFEHRVKSLSYEDDGFSRIWEEPILVLMYSFVVLIDFMMSTVFYSSCCKSYSMETCKPVLETMNRVVIHS